MLGDSGPRHQATLKALIQAGANLQLKDSIGQTPLALALALARARGYGAMEKLLLAAGAK